MTDIIEIARANFRRAISETTGQHLPDAGRRWATLCSHAQVMIEGFQDEREVISYAQAPESRRTRPGSRRARPERRSRGMLCRWTTFVPRHFRSLRTRIRVSSSRRCCLAPATTTVLRDRLVSAPLIFHMMTTMRVACLAIAGRAPCWRSAAAFWRAGAGLDEQRPASTNHYIDVDFRSRWSTPRSTSARRCLIARSSIFTAAMSCARARASRALPHRQSGCRPAAPDRLDREHRLDAGDQRKTSSPSTCARLSVRLANGSTASTISHSRSTRRPQSMNVAAPVMGADWKAIFRGFGGGAAGGAAGADVPAHAQRRRKSVAAAEAAVRRPPPTNG